MPAPTSKLSVDYWFYTYLYEPLSRQLCFIHPNYITIANFFMLIPLAYGLLHKWSLGSIIALSFIRNSLDCLDGAVARSCKKQSELGKILDAVSDYVTMLILAAVVIYMVGRNHGFDSLFARVLFGIMLTAAGLFTYSMFHSVNNTLEDSHVGSFLHDNTVLATVLTGIVAWWFVRV